MSSRTTRRLDTGGIVIAEATNSVASQEKKFLCSICQRYFNRREHLQRHQNIHYGRKPYHCKICSYSCRRRDLLSRHMKLTHKDIPNSNVENVENRSPRTNLNNAPASIYELSNENEFVPPESGVETDPLALPVPVEDTSLPISQPFNLNFLDDVSLPIFDGHHPFFPELPMLDLSPLSPETHSSTRIADYGNEEPRVADPSLTGRLSRFLSPQVEYNRRVQPTSTFPKVSHEDWAALAHKLSQFDSVLPENYELPSRHAMTRYLHRFMNGFQPHFPILHAPTLSFKEMAPELILAMAATGSQYCLEPHQGLKLFFYAHEIALEQIRRRDLEHQSTNRQSLSKEMPDEQSISDNGPRQRSRMDNESGMVETMQALFYLMAMATWNVTNRSLMRHAVATPSMLAMLVRQHGLLEQSHGISSWEEWSREESARRTKLIIFCFFNLHSIAMNLPSPIMISEIELFLPCSESEWRAVDAESWSMLHRQSECPPLFQDYLSCLNKNTRVPPCSSLGSHIMIHALIKRIFTFRQASLEPLLSVRWALKRWQTGWEQNPESSLTPLDRHGPIAFNSTALYRLAYIRLAVDIGPARSFLEQDDVQIAQRLKQLPPLRRGPLLTLAARHALAALCPPVQMGIFFIGQGHSWSVMHAVCSLDYAYVLSQFLKVMTSATLEYPLDNDEQSIVTAAKEILSEVEASRPDGNPGLVNVTPGALAAKVVRAWAMILENVRTWNAVTMITKTLFTYADFLEKDVGL